MTILSPSTSYRQPASLITFLRPDERVFWTEFAPLVSPRVSNLRLAGYVGLIAKSIAAPLRVSDLTGLWIPGLRACGLRAAILPVPEGIETLSALIRARLARNMPVAVYTEASLAPDLESAELRDPEVSGMVILHSSRPDSNVRENSNPLEQPVWDFERVKLATSAIIARRDHSPGRRSMNTLSALLRTVAFGAAYPNRLPTAAADEPVRAAAAEFLSEVAGAARDPFAVRLRRAATAYAEPGDVPLALAHLLEAVLIRLKVPGMVRSALSSEGPLTGIEQQELVYLARAGSRELRVIAASKLAQFADSGAQSTLAQLRVDPDAAVRAAVR